MQLNPPKYRPWTLQEVPLGKEVKHKNGDRAILSAVSVLDGAVLYGMRWYLLTELCNGNFTIDGSPCGVKE